MYYRFLFFIALATTAACPLNAQQVALDSTLIVYHGDTCLQLFPSNSPDLSRPSNNRNASFSLLNQQTASCYSRLGWHYKHHYILSVALLRIERISRTENQNPVFKFKEWLSYALRYKDSLQFTSGIILDSLSESVRF